MAISDKSVAYMQRKMAATVALAGNVAKQAEADMRQNAPWKDRTAIARQALHTGVVSSSGQIVVFLAHGMQYGAYMEMGTGKYGPEKRPYVIQAKNGKALRFLGPGGKAVIVRKVIHPGMKPRAIVKPTAKKYQPILRNAVLKLWGALQ